MPRILSIDYGKKKSGLAVTDPLKIIATPLDTIHTNELENYLQEYFEQEEVEIVVLGKPFHKDGTPTELWKDIERFGNKIKRRYPQMAIHYQDETLTSVEARKIILASGAKKEKRREKGLVDKVSAVLILQEFLGHI